MCYIQCVCVCVCVCVCARAPACIHAYTVCICMFVCTYEFVCTACMHICVYTYIWHVFLCIHLSVCVYQCLFVCFLFFLCVCMCVCVCVCVFVSTCPHIHVADYLVFLFCSWDTGVCMLVRLCKATAAHQVTAGVCVHGFAHCTCLAVPHLGLWYLGSHCQSFSQTPTYISALLILFLHLCSLNAGVTMPQLSATEPVTHRTTSQNQRLSACVADKVLADLLDMV